MRSQRPRRLAFLLAPSLLALCWQAPAGAQQAKAGVVTAVRGQVTVARAATPGAVAVDFMDDVFFEDRIGTGPGAVVRVLLGGRALLTVQDLSHVNIREEPNRVVVEMEGGRLALQVLRRLLEPGERFAISTPNALAEMRGGFVVVESATLDGSPMTTAFALGAAARVTVTSRVTGATFSLGESQGIALSGLAGMHTVGRSSRSRRTGRGRSGERPTPPGRGTTWKDPPKPSERGSAVKGWKRLPGWPDGSTAPGLEMAIAVRRPIVPLETLTQIPSHPRSPSSAARGRPRRPPAPRSPTSASTRPRQAGQPSSSS